MDPNALMKVALDAARRGIAAGQTPFGCAIARDGRILAASHNTVWLTTDITAHAEVNALREACRRTNEIHLNDAIVATTCEPCPMCMAALHWSRVSSVYFGATIADASGAGFNELTLSAAELLRQGGSQLQLQAGCLEDECRDLFQQWQRNGAAQNY